MPASQAAPPRISRFRRAVSAIPIAWGIGVSVAIVDGIAAWLWPRPVGVHPTHPPPRAQASIRTFSEHADGLREIRFRFEPDSQTKIVRFFFGLDDELTRATFQTVAVSASPDVPSSFERFELGRSVERAEIDGMSSSFSSSVVRLVFGPGRLQIVQDGRERAALSYAFPGSSVRMALYPSYPLSIFRADDNVLPELEFDVEADGRIVTHGGWRPWSHHVFRFALLTAVALGLARGALRSARCRAALRGTFYVCFVIPLALAFGSVIDLRALGCRGGGNSGHERELLGADGKLHLPDRDVAFRSDGNPLTVLAFGGSTTLGEPYDRPDDRFDYPSLLEDLLQKSPRFAGRPVQVLNLGKLGLPLISITDWMRRLVPVTRPTVVMLSSVYNNYFGPDPWILFLQVAGFPGARSPATPGSIEDNAKQLRCVARYCRSQGAIPLWIEEFIDPLYFGGENILRPLQQNLAQVAAEEGVEVLRFQDRAASDRDRLIFYEYIHPSSLGYRWMAEDLATWFEANADSLEQPRPRDSALDLSVCGTDR